MWIPSLTHFQWTDNLILLRCCSQCVTAAWVPTCGIHAHQRALGPHGIDRSPQYVRAPIATQKRFYHLISPSIVFFFFLFGRNAVCLCDLGTYCCPQKEPLFYLSLYFRELQWSVYTVMIFWGHGIHRTHMDMNKFTEQYQTELWFLNIFYGPFEMTYLTLPKGHFCA